VSKRWWSLPLSAEPYLSTLFLLLSVPLALWSLFDRGAAQQRLARRLIAFDPALSRVRPIAALPLDAISPVVVGYRNAGQCCGLRAGVKARAGRAARARAVP
jgi:hypothetical protein